MRLHTLDSKLASLPFCCGETEGDKMIIPFNSKSLVHLVMIKALENSTFIRLTTFQNLLVLLCWHG